MNNDMNVTIPATMTEPRIHATAYFFKLVDHDNYYRNANHNNPNDLEDMKGARNLLCEALAVAGFDPR